MSNEMYSKATPELAQKRRELAPKSEAAFQAFSKAVFADGALSNKTKQLIAVAVAHVTQCPYCIQGHTKAALRSGATAQELMEAVWVAAEMRAGAAFAHSTLMLDVVERSTSCVFGCRTGDRPHVGGRHKGAAFTLREMAQTGS
jgi:AhpD family alkylhydroperoxidase